MVALALEYLEISGDTNDCRCCCCTFSFKDFLKSFMLVELLKGMALTGRYAFRRKVTVQFPEERHLCPLGSVVFTHCVAMKMGKSVALLASSAKLLPCDGHHD